MAVSLVITGVQFPDNSIQTTRASQAPAFTNRIINGAMVIDQRNAGASVTVGSGNYPVDRWFAVEDTDGVLTAEQVEDAPTGFYQSTKITVTTADASLGAAQNSQLRQAIEGYNILDLNWGTANAASVTVSFWVKSSLTGTFGGSLRNATPDRSYIFQYTINAANTWEYKTITISGDTSGTWGAGNGVGIYLTFDLGSGTDRNGTANQWQSGSLFRVSGNVSVISTLNATFYITGVQLEKGSTATSFDYRPYTTELQLAQRYYYKVLPGVANRFLGAGFNVSTTSTNIQSQFAVPMRDAPTALDQNGTANNYMIAHTTNITVLNQVPAFSSATTTSALTSAQVSSALTAGQSCQLRTDSTNGATAYLAWSAEL